MSDPSAPEFADTRTWDAPAAATGNHPGGRGPGPSAGAPTATAPDLRPDGALPEIPDFDVLRSVGSGGMGSVFEAIHLPTRRRVALKLLLTGWPVDPVVRARFDREAEILAAIEHPHVVTVYHAGTWHGQQYLVMKFVSGGTLAQHLPGLRRDLPAACRLLATVARAVGHLHARGFVHRDLKPANVLIADDGSPVVADLGLARPLAGEPAHPITRSPVPMGTRSYMSPEQTRGGPDSYPPACDIWALGVILYELLAEARPFADDEPTELFRQIRCDPTPPVSHKRDAPPELEAIARRCLAKLPADRYPTAEALADDLEAWADGRALSPLAVPEPAPQPVAEPVPTQPEPAPPRPPRRSFAPIVALAALLATVAGALFALGGRDPVPIPPTALEVAPMPHPAPTLAQRVERWEDVELIGPKGEVRVSAKPTIPGSALVPGRDGYAQLNGLSLQYATLWGEPLPFPVELRGEVWIVGAHGPASHAGFVGGARPFRTAKGEHVLMWQIGAEATMITKIGDGDEYSQRGALRVCALRIGDKNSWETTLATTVPVVTVVRPDAADPGAWHLISITTGPNAVAGRFHAHSLPVRDPAARLRTHGLLNDLKFDDILAPTGDQFGVYVYDAEAVFRNVTLRRVRQP